MGNWITFPEVKVKGTKKWTDVTGKKRQKTKTFSQTINPFNKNKDGTQKTRLDILEELYQERDKWVADPKAKD